MQRFVQDAVTPAVLVNKDNEYLNYMVGGCRGSGVCGCEWVGRVVPAWR